MKIILAFLSLVLSFSVMAENTKCDPSWTICATSRYRNVHKNIRYVENLFVNGKYMAGPNQEKDPYENRLAIHNDTGILTLDDVVIGRLGSIGMDQPWQLVGEIIPEPGLSFELTIKDIPAWIICNRPKWEVKTIRFKYKRLAKKLTVKRDGEVLIEAEGKELIGEPISITSTYLPCEDHSE